MRRLTILLAALGALALVPAVGAQAEGLGTTTVEIGGAGKGSVSGKGGWLTLTEETGKPKYETSPPIECEYASPGPAAGICTATSGKYGSIVEGSFLVAHAAKGSEFAGWTLGPGTKNGAQGALCRESAGPESAGEKEWAKFEGEANFQGGQACLIEPENEEWFQEKAISAKVTFEPCAEASFEIGSGIPSCEGLGGGPTNLRTLTLTKSAGGTEGTGAVSSKPKGINCGTACDKAIASLYENSVVVLKAKAATGSTIASWSGCETSTGVGTLEGACTVTMTEAKEVEVSWAGTSKAILNPQPLTLSKGESTGKGTVKAAGLSCEAECDEVEVLYQGPTGVAPKNKPGKLVILKEIPAFGSELAGWSGCTPISATECEVTMEEAENVTAEFSAKPTTTLTVAKAGSGTGSVSSKPKAINCGTVCTTQDATVPQGEAIVLKEKPGTEMTFTGWSGGGCSGTAETCTVSLSEATAVTASFSGSPKPILNPQELTLTKAGSGYGTVKASGMGCEALCTSTVSLYQGPTGIAPKNKPGKTVILKAISAPGSKAVEWSGCTPISASECEVVMEEAEEVTATFDELE